MGAGPSPGGIDFTHPGFALLVREDVFYHSSDRAHTWQGPFAFSDFGLGGELTARTDYVVNGPAEALLFLSYEDKQATPELNDRACGVRTRDGGRTFERARDEFEIGYRHCAPATPREEWFAAAWFRLPPGDGATSRGIIKELLARRIATQPLSLPNAGSVFRNPDRDHAARLIESCGLKGFGRGGARVSEKHANFIVNPEGAASAADIEWLIQHIQRMVYQMKGVVLITEVRIVGEPA